MQLTETNNRNCMHKRKTKTDTHIVGCVVGRKVGLYVVGCVVIGCMVGVYVGIAVGFFVGFSPQGHGHHEMALAHNSSGHETAMFH